LKGFLNRPVVQVDITKAEFLNMSVFTLVFDGSELDETNRFGWIYLRFSDGLESFDFVTRYADFYFVG